MKVSGIIYKVKPAFVFGSDKTYEHNREVEVPVTSTTYINPIQVEWGDGTVETLDTASGTYPSHTYDTDDDDDEFVIRITSASGRLPALAFGEGTASIGTHPKARLTLNEIVYCNAEFYQNLSKVTSNSQMYFYNCVNLNHICNGIHKHDTSRIALNDCYCNTSITKIYGNMFVHCSVLRNVNGLFQNTKITSIPAGLFSNILQSNGSSVFAYCVNIVGSIPQGLFDRFTEATVFNYTFKGCVGLTSIPNGLFDKCPNVKNFEQIFNKCSSLKSIPDGLFNYNSSVTKYEYAFNECTSLAGNAPDLWATHSGANGTACFRQCTNLTNFADIPDDWK